MPKMNELRSHKRSNNPHKKFLAKMKPKELNLRKTPQATKKKRNHEQSSNSSFYFLERKKKKSHPEITN